MAELASASMQGCGCDGGNLHCCSHLFVCLLCSCVQRDSHTAICLRPAAKACCLQVYMIRDLAARRIQNILGDELAGQLKTIFDTMFSGDPVYCSLCTTSFEESLTALLEECPPELEDQVCSGLELNNRQPHANWTVCNHACRFARWPRLLALLSCRCVPWCTWTSCPTRWRCCATAKLNAPPWSGADRTRRSCCTGTAS